MGRQVVLQYKLLKVTGDNFDEASDLLEAAVNDFIEYCKDHNQYWEPSGRPAGWFNLGSFHMTIGMVLKGQHA